MRIEWLQVPDDVVLVRSKTLATLLSVAFGKKVSHGDALLYILKVWMWVVAQVDEDNPDLSAEFARCGVLDRVKAEAVFAGELGLPHRLGVALVDALLDPSVRILDGGGQFVRVREVEERYTQLAKKQGESRGRARVSRLARESGWVATKGGKWVNETTGEELPDWRALEARLDKKGSTP